MTVDHHIRDNKINCKMRIDSDSDDNDNIMMAVVENEDGLP